MPEVTIKELTQASTMWSGPDGSEGWNLPIRVLIGGVEIPLKYGYCSTEAVVLRPSKD